MFGWWSRFRPVLVSRGGWGRAGIVSGSGVLGCGMDEIASRLGHVYWVGGGSGAGKSTVARRLAERYGWRVYSTDASMREHAGRASVEDAPFLHAFIRMTMDERWVERSPEVMFETFHWFRGEGFEFIVEDLLRLPRDTCVVVEGFRLLPGLVEPLLGVAGRAVWLLPTAEFRSVALRRRVGLGGGFLARTSDPGRAERNLAERERLFVGWLREELGRLGLRGIEVDRTMSEEDVEASVARAFEL